MAYTKTDWTTGAPITQERMNKIEDGIASATQTGDNNTENIAQLNTRIQGTVEPNIRAIQDDITNMRIDMTSIAVNATQGHDAWTEVARTVLWDENTDPPSIKTHMADRMVAVENQAGAIAMEVGAARGGHGNLNMRLDNMSGHITAIYGDIDSINNTFVEASASPYENTLGFASTVKGRLDNSEEKLIAVMSELATAHESTAFGHRKVENIDNSYGSLDARLEEGEQRIVDLENEISSAHESTALGKTGLNSYETLDARFEAIESELIGPTSMSSRLDTIEGNVGALSDNKVNKTDIANNLTTNTTGKVLDAYQGKLLNDGKINYTDIIDNVSSIDIDRPLSANQGKVLADRIDLIDNATTGTVHGLDERLTAAENAISHTAANDDPGGLTQRLTAAESDINTIANELSMYNTQTGAIEDTNSRVDTIEANVVAMAKEIGMLQDDDAVVDLSTAVSRTNTKVDTIEEEIEAAHRILNEGTDTLDNRFDDAETRLATLESDLNTANTGVKARINTLESDLNTAATGIKARLDAIDTPATGAIAQLQEADTTLDARLDAIDGGTVLTGTVLKDRLSTVESDINTASTGIKARLTTLEGKDTIIISKPTSGSNYYAGTPDIQNPSTEADYLIQADDDKYYYWRYFGSDVGWQLVGGAGGSGNNSGYDYPNAQDYDDLQIKEENTDYYVNRADGYHHYRWVTLEDSETNLPVLTEIEIGTVINTNNIKKYNIARVDTTRTNAESGQTEEVSYLNLYEFDYGADNTVIDDESTSMHLRAQVELPKGGGGGSSTTSINKLVRIGNQAIQTIVGATIKLQMFYSSWDENESSDGTYVLKSGDTIIDTGTFNSGAKDETINGWKANTAGYYEFDVTDKCKVGNTSFSIVVTVNGVNLGKSWTVNIIDLHIESDAPDTLLLNTDNTYSFSYVPFGALTKTLHVLIDGTEVGTQTLVAATSGRINSYVIPAQAHGAHTIEMYLTALIGNTEQRTESIIREYIWYNPNNTSVPVILASKYNEQTITATQYSTIEIPYQVYKKDANTIDVYYYLDNEETEFDKVTLDGINTGVLSYLAADSGDHTITIKVDNVSIQINLAISALSINVAPVSGAIIDFDPTTLTNNSTNRLPTWTDGNNTYGLTVSDNFNWSDDISGGGYKNDTDGKCFIIKAGSYVDLNYPLFARKENNTKTVLDTGAELKIIFKTKAVRNIDAVWFNNTGTLTEKPVGIQLGAHYGWLKTDKATNTNTKDTVEEYPAWDPATSYEIDDIVVSKNVIYKCIKVCVNNTNIVPGTSNASSWWEVVSEAEDTPEVWALGTEYAKGTIVTYNSTLYKAKKDILNEPTTNPKDLSDNWLKMGATESETIATNSYLYFPYSEEDKIELDININAYNANSDNNFIMSYEDGVPSKAYAYSYGAGGDGLYHNNTIRIGSPDCDVYIYRLRIYKNSLDTDQILQNFIADGRNIDEKVERYNRNCIYWDDTLEQYFTSPSGTAVLDPIKLAERMPDVKILMLDTPVFTVGKKNFVQGSTLRCIHADGGTIYESRGDADNWFFTNGFHAGQGTTSDNYGQSARNVDFLFEVDGVNYPTKAKNMKGYTPSNEYVSQVYIGKNASEWVEVDSTNHVYAWQPKAGATPSTCTDWKGDTCKISLTETSIPNNYFNLKVNVASSENVNNALFQKRYNEFLEYNSPAQAAQMAKHGTAYRALGLNTSKLEVKNGMEFVPAILFVRENDSTQDGNGNYIKHTEFNDTKWHFYALGNLGDSKKTDYTRAYDPDDMNEFTCENSDNNTNNGQFQSGIFTYNNHRAIETPYEAYDNTKEYAEGDIVVDDGVIKIYDGANWSNATLTGWTDQDTPYFAPYTAPNPMQYLYPITKSEWNVQISGNYVNYKHYTLVTEEFDGDHSFEFRYACRGDYRDGDLINESEGQDDDAQFNLNHDVMLAFYEWLITATEEQYAAEAAQWFVKPAMEFFYAFTHYYTMMDNRAKNTFWHFAKTGVRQAVPIGRAFPALMHIYEEKDGNNYVPASGEFDNSKQYYTQYAFDLWIYDTDTAAGIDNNGALVFPYGKEDTDYRTEGDPNSGYAFNGAGSIFWRRLRTTFANEITEIMNNADANCFNSEDLINQFDEFQGCFPEEIWRLDIERKYIRTFTGKSVDNSVTTGKQNPRFLTSMMQGRKKYQRRQWIRDQGVYFNSKYRLTNIISNDNTIEFNCTTPAEIENIALTPSYYLKLTPYQDMYLNVQVGNGNYQPQIRAKAGQEYTYNLSGNYQETRIYINGANHLSGIGNLAPMYPYSFDLRALAHIKTLDIGTDVEGYTNTKFTELVLPNYMPLLESLNIKNCHSIGGTINLSQANNIRTVEATGTSITGVSLPDYTNIETLHLPSSVTAVSLYGARFLKDFKILNNAGNEDYSGLYTLNVYDSDYSINLKEDSSDPLPVDWINIALAMLAKESTETQLSLLKLYSATIGNIETLEPISELKSTIEDAGGHIDLSGLIHVTGTWSVIERDYYGGTNNSIWPDLEFDTSAGTQQSKHKVTYRYNDYQDDEGNIITGETIKILYINDGATAPDIYSNGTLDEMPSRASTVRESYEFGMIDNLTDNYIPYSGWQLSGTSSSLYETGGAPIIRSDTIIETHFNTNARTYYVNWYMRRNAPSTLVKTSTAPVRYGEGYNLEAPTVKEIHAAGQDTCTINISNGSATYSIFNGWEKLPTNINPTASDTTYDIYANWESGTVIIDDLFNVNNINNLTPIQLLVLSALDATSKNTYSINTKIAEGTRVTYTLGHDSIVAGTPLIVNNPLRLDGATDASYATNIQPLKEGNDAFTLVIDYCFNPNVTYPSQYSFATLASCYYGPISTEGIRNGFSLFYGTGSTISGPRVGFGDMYNDINQSVSVGNENTLGQRNIVVLRHPAGSSTLYVYSGLDGNNTMPSDVVVNTLTWSNFNSNAYLNFGRLTSEATDILDGIPQIVTNAKGTIFWSKYWNQDLGAGECKRLAAWPHEQTTYAISRLNSASTSLTRVSSTQPVVPSIYLSALSSSLHGKVVQSAVRAQPTFSGRDNSIARTICNNRIFEALPTQLQAIMCQPSIAYTVVTYTSNNQGVQSYDISQTAAIGKDYVFQYSVANLINDSSSAYATREDTYSHPFAWFNNANVEAYTYSIDRWVINNTDTTAANYLNIRFPFKAINWGTTNKLRVFRELSQAIPNGSTIAETIASTGEIKSGDIYIDTNNKTYIYVLNNEMQTYGIQIMPTTGDYAKFSTNNVGAQYRGGWIPADDYWTRSAIKASNGANFAYSETYGTPNVSTINSANSLGLSLMYTIAI